MDPSIDRIPNDPATRAMAPRRVGPKQRKDAPAHEFAQELEESEEEETESRHDADTRHAERHVAPPAADEAGSSLDVTG